MEYVWMQHPSVGTPVEVPATSVAYYQSKGWYTVAGPGNRPTPDVPVFVSPDDPTEVLTVTGVQFQPTAGGGLIIHTRDGDGNNADLDVLGDAAATVNETLDTAGVMYASAAPALGTNRALDPQSKTTGGTSSNTLYPLTRLTAGLPAGFAYGLKTTRAGALSTTISQHFHGVASGTAAAWSVTPGEVISARVARVWTDQTGARARIILTYLDAAGATLSGQSVQGTASDIVANAYEERSIVNATVPALAASVYITVAIFTTSGGDTVVGAVGGSTGAQIVSGPSLAPYGDGSFSAATGWTWLGAAHASVSKKVYTAASDLTGTDADLVAWATGDAYRATGSIVTDGPTGLITSAAVTWPDGATGTFTGTVNANAALRAYDGWSITHVSSSRKVTQAAPTRDGNGYVSAQPAPTVGVI